MRSGGVLAFIEGAVGDALEELRVVLQRPEVAPSDLVRAVAEVVITERLSRASIASISAFFCAKAASASWLDLVFGLWVLVIISGSVLLCRTR
jgi:hypothetical protein